MVKTLEGAVVFTSGTPEARSLKAIATLRLVLGLAALLGAIIFLEGTSWDIQWHSFIGRDRTLIPPHIMMLTGVTLSGIAGLLAVLIESWWTQRNMFLSQFNVSFVGIFSAPLGAYVVGYAALTAAVAFPLDAYWHSLYGIDVAIWAPFHVMFIASMGIVALGTAFLLSSAARVAADASFAGSGIKRASLLGVVVSLAAVLGLFTLLLFDSVGSEHMLSLGFLQVSVFPLLSSLLVAFTFVAAGSALPWRWAATLVGVCYLMLAGIMALFVQPATDWLLNVEHLKYRDTPPATAIVALEWFITPLVVAILIDVIRYRAGRKQWSRRKQSLLQAFSSLLSGALPVLLIYPLLPVMLIFQFEEGASQNCATSAPCSVQLIWLVAIAGYLFSLLLGLAGAYLGTLFGRNIGESLDSLER